MDIRPRCCVHHESEMVPVEVCGKIDEHPCSFRAFACEAGCDQLYNIVHGYFELSGGKISSLGQFRRPCPNDESPMYLESTDVDKTGVGSYRCSQFGCDGEGTGFFQHKYEGTLITCLKCFKTKNDPIHGSV